MAVDFLISLEFGLAAAAQIKPVPVAVRHRGGVCTGGSLVQDLR